MQIKTSPAKQMSMEQLEESRAKLDAQLQHINFQIDQLRLKETKEKACKEAYQLIYDEDSYTRVRDIVGLVEDIEQLLAYIPEYDPPTKSSDVLLASIRERVANSYIYVPNHSHIYPCPDCSHRDVLHVFQTDDGTYMLKCDHCGYTVEFSTQIRNPLLAWSRFHDKLTFEGYNHDNVPFATVSHDKPELIESLNVQNKEASND